MDIRVRSATLEDKTDILNIQTDNVYDGVDYLEFFFDTFLLCPYSKCYVAHVNEKVVGFRMATVIDHGTTNVTRAGRVSPEFEGMGVFTSLSEHIDLEMNGKTRVLIVSILNPAYKNERFLRGNRELLMMTVAALEFDVKKILPLFQNMSNATGVFRPDSSLLEKYMCSPKISKYLFPEGRMVVNLIPFKALPSYNIPMLNMYGVSILTNVTEGKDGTISGLITVATSCECEDPGYFWYIDIFGTDETSLKHHFYTQIVSLGDKYWGNVFICAVANPAINDHILKWPFVN